MYAVALGSPCVLVQINSSSLLISSSRALITKLSHLIHFLKIKDFKMDSFSLSINSVIDIHLFSYPDELVLPCNSGLQGILLPFCWSYTDWVLWKLKGLCPTPPAHLPPQTNSPPFHLPIHSTTICKDLPFSWSSGQRLTSFSGLQSSPIWDHFLCHSGCIVQFYFFSSCLHLIHF